MFRPGGCNEQFVSIISLSVAMFHRCKTIFRLLKGCLIKLLFVLSLMSFVRQEHTTDILELLCSISKDFVKVCVRLEEHFWQKLLAERQAVATVGSALCLKDVVNVATELCLQFLKRQWKPVQSHASERRILESAIVKVAMLLLFEFSKAQLWPRQRWITRIFLWKTFRRMLLCRRTQKIFWKRNWRFVSILLMKIWLSKAQLLLEEYAEALHARRWRSCSRCDTDYKKWSCLKRAVKTTAISVKYFTKYAGFGKHRRMKA